MSFDQRHATRSPPNAKSIWVGRYNNIIYFQQCSLRHKHVGLMQQKKPEYLHTPNFFFPWLRFFSPYKNVPRLYSILISRWMIQFWDFLWWFWRFSWVRFAYGPCNIIVSGASEPSFLECGWPADDLKRHISRELDPDPPRSSEQKLFLLLRRISYEFKYWELWDSITSRNKGGKFLKKLRCCVGVEYNKIIWFHQMSWQCKSCKLPP